MPFGGAEDRPGSRHGYSFGSICSFRSIKRNGSQNSQKEGVRGRSNIADDFDYNSNESVEMLMMKSAKSANVGLVQIRPEANKRRHSGFGKLTKKSKPNWNNKLSKSNQLKKFKIMKSYFEDTDADALGDDGSHKKSLGSDND